MSPAAAEAEEPRTEETVDDADAVDDENEAGDELSEQDEIDLQRLDAALATLDDESLRRGLSGITEKQRQELAVQLNLPRATMHLGEALTPLVRRKLRGLPVDRQLMVASALTNRANDATVRALGDRSDDPSRADLEEVLPDVIEQHGIELARLMVASYAVSDAPCRDAMREIHDTDEGFAIPEAPDEPDADPDETELPSFGLVARTPRKKGEEDPERARLLEQRKAQKAERRAAAAHERAARAAAEAARREALHASKRAHP
ncbi:MAG TPA: hypothetical protein VL769_09600 [Acidimicrobiia bacterium]|nr:hypothetical protein [Acidimicrobiia bacterium]